MPREKGVPCVTEADNGAATDFTVPTACDRSDIESVRRGENCAGSAGGVDGAADAVDAVDSKDDIHLRPNVPLRESVDCIEAEDASECNVGDRE